MLNNVKTLFVLVVLFGVGLFFTKNLNHSSSQQKAALQETQKVNSYYTCPMHPQIHQDHEGECPICHMRLVKMKDSPTLDPMSAQSNELKTDEETADKRAEVQLTSQQMELIGAHKIKVEKMDLKIRIPISGRILTTNSVAFQIYENDLHYIHTGLNFTGESSALTEESIKGVITNIDSMIDPSSRTLRVVGSILKGPQGLIPETSFSGQIELDLKNRMVIPESSVVHTGTQELVYVFKEGLKLVPRAVKLGLKSEGFYEILKGLDLDEEISSGPNFLIDSESKIRGAND
jgi:Cu(I)/Ag(I) efflux system membrane fusion protein